MNDCPVCECASTAKTVAQGYVAGFIGGTRHPNSLEKWRSSLCPEHAALVANLLSVLHHLHAPMTREAKKTQKDR
jgi:hypothetical protein